MNSETDPWTIRLVIGNLGLIGLLCVIGGLILAFYKIESPTWVANLAFATITGLLGWLVPSPVKVKKNGNTD